MKIGILTYHRSHNYGALLQAVALRYILENLGHEAYYIDYWPKYHRRMYALVNWRNLLTFHFDKAYTYITKKVIEVYGNRKLRIKNMESFISKYIQPYCLAFESDFDIVIYGSDQIWRKQPVISSYNPVYFGANNIHCKKHISFSASMGLLPQNPNDCDMFRNLISHLDKIAVREVELKMLLQKLGYPNVSLTLDPVLLLSSDQWDKILNIGAPEEKEGFRLARANKASFSLPSVEKLRVSEDYVLYYNLMPNSFDVKEIENFAESHQCALKILYGLPIKEETNEAICTVSPNGFVNLIKNARFVFTSSYHGLAFSLIYHKPFWASFSKNASRAKSLLEQLGLNDRLLSPMTKISHMYLPINYVAVDGRLKNLQRESLNFLKEI